MKTSYLMRTLSLCAFVVACFPILMVTGHAAADSEHGSGKRGGTLGCGGNYNNAATQATFWVFRNFNDSDDIRIDRMRFYDAQGSLLFDSENEDLPAASNGALGPDDAVLESHQAAQYASEDLYLNGVLPNITGLRRPIQLIVDWSAQKKVYPLAGTTVRSSRLGVDGVESARHSEACRDLDLPNRR